MNIKPLKQILSPAPGKDSRVRRFKCFAAYRYAWLAIVFVSGFSAAQAQQPPPQTPDPLTITNGNVGVGTATPTNKLSVAGNADVSGNVGIGTTAPANKLSVAGNADVSGNVGIGKATPTNRLSVAGDADVSGNVGIGTTAPAAKLDVGGKVLLQNADGRNYVKDVEKSDGKGLRVGALWGQYGVYAETGMGALGGADGVTLQNGGLTLDGNGNVKTSGSINGEEQPFVFEVGNKGDTTNWSAVQIPGDIIQKYLGDADGGTIRINFRVNDSDEVRTITETIYIEQPDKSNNRNSGLHGWTRQLGGGERGFVLDTTNRTDVIPSPWDWMWVRNYASPEPPGRGGNTGNAWTGADKYKLEFMTRPNISATVIIYDR